MVSTSSPYKGTFSACNRCRQEDYKCTGQKPSCRTCFAAGVECVYAPMTPDERRDDRARRREERMLREIIKLFPASSSTSPSLSRRGSVDPGSPQSSQTSVPTALSPDPSAPSMFDSFLSSAFQSNQSTALSDEALTNSFDCDQQHSPKKRKRTLSPRQPPVSARPRMPGKNTHRILRPLHSAVHPPSNTDTLTEWLASAYTENIRPVSHAINPWGDPVCSHVRTSVEEEDEVNASCASDERSLSSVDSVSDGSVSRGETYVRKRYEPIRDSHLPIARPVAMVRPASSRLDDAVDSVVYQPPTMQPFILNQTLFYSRRREPCAVCANDQGCDHVPTGATLSALHSPCQTLLSPSGPASISETDGLSMCASCRTHSPLEPVKKKQKVMACPDCQLAKCCSPRTVLAPSMASWDHRSEEMQTGAAAHLKSGFIP